LREKRGRRPPSALGPARRPALLLLLLLLNPRPSRILPLTTQQDRGYFSRPLPPVGQLPEPIDFSKLVGQAEYRALLARAHSAAGSSSSGAAGAAAAAAASSSASSSSSRLLGGGDWLTPAEIFRPWYGAAVARYVLEAHAVEGRRQLAVTAAAASGGGRPPAARDGEPHPSLPNKKLTPMLHDHTSNQSVQDGGGGRAATASATAATAAALAAAAANPATTTPTTAPDSSPLYIVEIGGGTGALALSILDHIRDHGPPGLYERTTYACIEVSAPLAARQRSAVGVEGGHARAFVSVVGDATERTTWDEVKRLVPGMPVVLSSAEEADQGRRPSPPSSSPSSPSSPSPLPPTPRVFVLAMEVLDNLPHDRVERAAPGQPWLQTAVAPKAPRDAARRPSSSSRGGWVGGTAEEAAAEAQSQQQQQQQWRQVLQPVEDPLVSRCARVVLPLLASASGGDHLSPAVLAGIEEEREEEEEEREGGPAAPFAAAAASNAPPPSSTSTTTNPSWGWDPAAWLRRLLAAATGEQLDPVAVWLPTGALALAECLHAALPGAHTLVASDFDALPGVQVEGHGAPIVSGRRLEERADEEEEEEEEEEESGGSSSSSSLCRQRKRLRQQLVARDHAGVLVPWGTADIFFPTDFDALAALYASAAASDPVAAAATMTTTTTSASPPPPQVSCQHMPTSDFMAAFAESKRTRTLSGYNPLLQDFRNTRFFIGEASARRA